MDFFEWLSSNIGSFWDKLLDALPKSPIYYLTSNPEVEKVMGYVNFFIPVYTIVGMLEAWLFAILVYYGLQMILRWIKFVE